MERVLELFQVVLVGPEGGKDLLKQKALRLPCLQVNTRRRLYNYLRVRAGYNGGVLPDGRDLPTLAALEASLRENISLCGSAWRFPP
jgi:hypothetical protein